MDSGKDLVLDLACDIVRGIVRADYDVPISETIDLLTFLEQLESGLLVTSKRPVLSRKTDI